MTSICETSPRNFTLKFCDPCVNYLWCFGRLTLSIKLNSRPEDVMNVMDVAHGLTKSCLELRTERSLVPGEPCSGGTQTVRCRRTGTGDACQGCRICFGLLFSLLRGVRVKVGELFSKVGLSRFCVQRYPGIDRYLKNSDCFKRSVRS
jgi:hypothetical protein